MFTIIGAHNTKPITHNEILPACWGEAGRLAVTRNQHDFAQMLLTSQNALRDSSTFADEVTVPGETNKANMVFAIG